MTRDMVEQSVREAVNTVGHMPLLDAAGAVVLRPSQTIDQRESGAWSVEWYTVDKWGVWRWLARWTPQHGVGIWSVTYASVSKAGVTTRGHGGAFWRALAPCMKDEIAFIVRTRPKSPEYKTRRGDGCRDKFLNFTGQGRDPIAISAEEVEPPLDPQTTMF